MSFESRLSTCILLTLSCPVEIIRRIYGRAGIWNFSSSVQLGISRLSAASEWDIELNTRRDIPYPRAEVSAGVLKEILFQWNWRLYEEGFRPGWKSLSFFHFFSPSLQKNASMRIYFAFSYKLLLAARPQKYFSTVRGAKFQPGLNLAM